MTIDRPLTGPVLPARAPRLVATDLDGTLLDPSGNVSPRTVAALRTAADAGVDVVFVTARPHRWLVEVAPHVAGHGVAICANGASVVDVATLAVLEDHGMTPGVVVALAARLRDTLGGAGRVHLAAESADGFAREHGFVSSHPVPDGTPSAERIEDVLGPSTLKLLVQTDDPPGPEGADAFSAAVAAAVGDLATAADSGALGLGEISARHVSKAATLAAWTARRGIDAADVWAVGDAPNDLSMLGWAGTSFAVANAHPAVRAAVDHLLPSNGEDGVALLLEHAGALAGTLAGHRGTAVTPLARQPAPRSS